MKLKERLGTLPSSCRRDRKLLVFTFASVNGSIHCRGTYVIVLGKADIVGVDSELADGELGRIERGNDRFLHARTGLSIKRKADTLVAILPVLAEVSVTKSTPRHDTNRVGPQIPGQLLRERKEALRIVHRGCKLPRRGVLGLK